VPPKRRSVSVSVLALLYLCGLPAHAAGIDWGQQVLNSVNNLVTSSGGVFVHYGLVMVAWAGFFKMMWIVIEANLDFLGNWGSHHIHVPIRELVLTAFQMWLCTQLLNYWMVPLAGGFSIHQLPMYITDRLVNGLQQGQIDQFQQYVSNVGANIQQPSPLAIVDVIIYLAILFLMGVLSAVTFILTSFGYVGEAIMVVLAPLFFWCTFFKTVFSWFWNIVQSMFSFAAYRLVATVILYILADVLVFFFVHGIGVDPVTGAGGDYSIGNWLAVLPIVVMLTALFIFALFMIPLICASIFNGAGALGQAATIATVQAGRAIANRLASETA
jgi:hypothetical protein